MAPPGDICIATAQSKSTERCHLIPTRVGGGGGPWRWEGWKRCGNQPGCNHRGMCEYTLVFMCMFAYVDVRPQKHRAQTH